MAFSSAALTADEVSFFSADKPLVAPDMGTVDGALADAMWAAGLAGTFASGDITSTDGPAFWVTNGLPHLKTLPNAAGTTFSLLLDMGADGIEFDCLALLNHNLFSAGCTSFSVRVSDLSDFSVSSIILSVDLTAELSADTRYANFSLKHSGSDALRYSGVRYIRVQIQLSGSGVPEIGSLILGRRTQLEWAPDYPFNPDQFGISSYRNSSESGVKQRGARNAGARTVSASIKTRNDTRRDDVVTFWRNLGYGQGLFMWVDNPSSAPLLFNYMHPDDDDLIFPRAHFGRSDWGLRCVEQGPESVFLESEA